MTISRSRPAAPKLLVIAAFAAVYVIWGSTYLAIRFAIETLPPFLMAATRFLVAGGLLYGALRLSGVPRPERAHWWAATIIGSLMLLCGNGGVVWAEQFVPSGLTALLVATVPLFIVLFEWIGPDRQRPPRLTVLGLALGFAGVAALVGDGSAADAARVPWIPAAVLLFASASWACGSLYARRAALPRSPLLSTAMQMLGGGAGLAVAGLLRGEVTALDLQGVSWLSAGALVYLILFGSLIAFSAYVWLLRVSTPARASTYAYVNPVVAVLLGALLAGEPLTPRIGFASLLIVAAVAAVIVGKQTGSGRR